MTRSASGVCRLLEAQKAEWGLLDCRMKVYAPIHAVAVILLGLNAGRLQSMQHVHRCSAANLARLAVRYPI